MSMNMGKRRSRCDEGVIVEAGHVRDCLACMCADDGRSRGTGERLGPRSLQAQIDFNVGVTSRRTPARVGIAWLSRGRTIG